MWDAFPRITKTRLERIERIPPQLEGLSGEARCKRQNELVYQAQAAYLSELRHFVRGQEHQMALWVSAHTQHASAVGNNMGNRYQQAMLHAHLEQWVRAIYYGPVMGAAHQFIEGLEFEYCTPPKPSTAGMPQEKFESLEGFECPALVQPGKLKGRFLLLEVGLSCGGIDLEVALPTWSEKFGKLGPYIQLTADWSGNTTLFAGIKVSAKTPWTGSSGFSVKEAVYLKFGKDGLEDGGMFVEGKGSLTLSGDSGSANYEGKFQQEFSVVAAVEYWQEQWMDQSSETPE